MSHSIFQRSLYKAIISDAGKSRMLVKISQRFAFPFFRFTEIHRKGSSNPSFRTKYSTTSSLDMEMGVRTTVSFENAPFFFGQIKAVPASVSRQNRLTFQKPLSMIERILKDALLSFLSQDLCNVVISSRCSSNNWLPLVFPSVAVKIRGRPRRPSVVRWSFAPNSRFFFGLA